MTFTSSKSFLALCLVLLSSTVFAGKSDWEHDINQALRTSQSEDKDLLIDFTGSDWCHWCIQLTNEVFSDAGFVAEASESFVLTELDFPADKANQPDHIAAQNNEWSERLEIDGFPTVVLADSKGRPYAKLGYEPGGPTPYLEKLNKLREKRITRDAAFAAAEKQTGVKRAESLDEGLRAVGAEFAFTSYKEVVDEIMQLDADNKGGLLKKYEQFIARRAVGKEVQQLMACYQPGLEAEYIDQIKQLEEKYQPEGKLKAEVRGVLAQLLMLAKRPQEAIELANEVLANETIHPKSKLQWRIMKAVALSADKKIEAAFEVIDSISADHADNERILAACVGQKAQIMVENDRISEAHSIVKDAMDGLSDDRVIQEMQKMLTQIESRMTAIDG